MSNKEIPVVTYNSKGADIAVNPRWWTIEEGEVHRHLFAVVKDLESRQGYRRLRNLRHARLYSNLELMGLTAGQFSRAANETYAHNRVTLNVIQSCVDTAGSKIGKMRPRPMFLTEDGDWDQQERAKLLTKYMDGVFDRMKLYEEKQTQFVDAAVFGTGEIHYYTEDGQVKAERVITDEILVEDADGMYGNPLVKHRIKFVNRYTLIEMFQEHADKILEASNGLPGELRNAKTNDIVRVIESWKLPSAAGASDGRHVICVDNADLLTEEWKKPYHVIVPHRWSKRLMGYDGQGIAEQLVGIQLELNKLLRTAQVAQHLMCVPRIWVENNSMANAGSISNEIGSVGKYSGQPPVATTWPALPPEIYQHIENLYRKAYEIVGISQLSANSQKPAGLNSGAALRTYQDVESDRFELVGQRWERSFCDEAEIIVDLTKDLSAAGHKPFVLVKNGKAVERINWKDVDMKRDEYELRVFPTSILPTQPAAKLQTVTELTQSGFMDKDFAMSLLDFPDVEGFISLKTAAIDDIKMLITRMIGKGIYESPEPFMNLDLAKGMAQSAYLRARTQKVPEDRLELLRRFMDACQQMMQDAQAAMAPPPGAAPAGPPIAKGAPLPMNDLLPPGQPGGAAPMPMGAA